MRNYAEWLELIASNREVLWKAELTGWLHNIGKLHPYFFFPHLIPPGPGLDFRDCCDVSGQAVQASRYGDLLPQAHLREEFSLPSPFESTSIARALRYQKIENYDSSGNAQTKKKLPDLRATSRFDWLLAIAHDRVADLEKEIPEGKDPVPERDLAKGTIFGYEEIRNAKDIAEAWASLGATHDEQWTILLDRVKFLKLAGEHFSRFPAETRRPINDITLWDISSGVAAVLKATVARCLLEEKVPGPVAVMTTPGGWQAIDKRNDRAFRYRFLRVAVDGRSYLGRSHRIPDLLGRKERLKTLYDRIGEYFETTIWLGNEVYRDDQGPVFLCPVFSDGDETGEIVRKLVVAGLSECIAGTEAGREIAWQIQVSSPDSRGLGLGRLLRESAPGLVAPLENLEAWWRNKSGELCPVCGLRPMETVGRAGLQKVCSECHEGRMRRSVAWLQQVGGKGPSGTIWLDELADQHGRLSLLTAEFLLGPWLEPKGDPERSEISRSLFLSHTDEAGNEQEKPTPKMESFARTERVKRTALEFWTGLGEEIRHHLTKNKVRLALAPVGGQSLSHGHAYYLQNARLRLSVVWDSSRATFYTAENLEAACSRNKKKLDVLQGYLRDEPFRLLEQTGYGGADRTVAESIRFQLVTVLDGGYSSYIEIAKEPGRWQVLVPASEADDCARLIWKRYETQMAYVRDRFPIRIANISAPSSITLFTLVQAAWQMAAAPWREETWQVATAAECGETLIFENGARWHYPPLRNGKPDLYASYVRANLNDPEAKTSLASRVPMGASVALRTSTYDAEFLLAASDRFVIFYDAERKRRPGVRREFPIALEMFSRLEDAWKILSSGNQSGQLHQAYLFLRQKEEEWGFDEENGSAEHEQEWTSFQKWVLEELEWRILSKGTDQGKSTVRRPTPEEWTRLELAVKSRVLLPALEWHLKILKDTRAEPWHPVSSSVETTEVKES